MVKKFEEYSFDTVNYNDLDNWSVDKLKNKDTYTGTKEFDFKLAQKVKDLFEDYNLFIYLNDDSDWLKQQRLVLSDEKIFKEWRVYVNEVNSFDDWLGYEHDINIDDIDENQIEEYENEYEKSKKKEKNYEQVVEFSVFLPLNVKDRELAAFADASNYLKLLNNMPDLLKFVTENALDNNAKGFKKFINTKGIKITNDNVEDVLTVNERLRKDSKVFGYFRDNFGENETKQLFNDWLKLL